MWMNERAKLVRLLLANERMGMKKHALGIFKAYRRAEDDALKQSASSICVCARIQSVCLAEKTTSEFPESLNSASAFASESAIRPLPLWFSSALTSNRPLGTIKPRPFQALAEHHKSMLDTRFVACTSRGAVGSDHSSSNTTQIFSNRSSRMSLPSLRLNCSLTS